VYAEEVEDCELQSTEYCAVFDVPVRESFAEVAAAQGEQDEDAAAERIRVGARGGGGGGKEGEILRGQENA
jgi:hypothetical protein